MEYLLKSNVDTSIELDTIKCANWLIDWLIAIVTFYIYALVVEGDYSSVTRWNHGNINRTNLSLEETEKQVPVLSRCPCWPIPESSLSDFLLTTFSHPKYYWNIACCTLINQSINHKLVLFLFPGIPTGDPATVAFYNKRIYKKLPLISWKETASNMTK
jgi:hypothetical protein